MERAAAVLELACIIIVGARWWEQDVITRDASSTYPLRAENFLDRNAFLLVGIFFVRSNTKPPDADMLGSTWKEGSGVSAKAAGHCAIGS